MMKYTFFFAVSLLFVFSVCSCSSGTMTVKSSPNAEKTPIANTNAMVNSNNVTKTKSFDLTKIKSEHPLVWVGAVSFENETLSSENVNWTLGDEAVEEKIEKDEVIIVDIMNCAGYLGSGSISYSTKIENIVPEWRLTFSIQTVASDALDKIKKCSKTPPDNEAFQSSEAFAVAPTNDQRKNIKTSKVDTQKLFASLPADVKKWLNSDINVKIWERPKNNLSLISDNWTDVDGDGQIDLIQVYGYNDEEHGHGIILYLDKGKWKEIGGISPL